MYELLDCDGTSTSETYNSHTKSMQDALAIYAKRPYLPVIHAEFPSLRDLWIKFDNPSITNRDNSQWLIPPKYSRRHTTLAQHERGVTMYLTTSNKKSSELLFASVIDWREMGYRVSRVCVYED